MTLDVSTLTFAGGLAAQASGVLLLIHWWQAREDRAALSWGIANCGMGIGIALLALQAGAPDGPGQIVGPMIISICAAEIWAAARIFRRGAVERPPMIAAVVGWLAAMMIGGAIGSVRLAETLNLVGCAASYLAAAMEFWLVGDERPRGRWVLISLLGLEAVALLLAAVDLNLSHGISGLPALNWLGAIHFVGLIFSAGAAISLITMLKDRSELKHKTAALVDPLTGLANRRAIMTFVGKLFDENLIDNAPISVLAFDLDHFKKINDSFGHPTGDRVLRIFADVLSSTGGKNDLAGRMGGEEFALALADCGIERALAVAGHVRVVFQENGHFVDGQYVRATVSVGVATAPYHGTGVAGLFASADIALYRAKNLGRNRVILSVGSSNGGPPAAITRIA
jgi:diguanylate cyclase (GGDEF)-like protein